MASRIEDYALIGDCETAALVARDGSIDWLCLPRFDSAACFAALLGTPEHGRWLIAPAATRCAPSRRRYRPGTLVLETDYETDDGAATLIDCMPIARPTRTTSCASSRGGAAAWRCTSSWSCASTTDRSCPWVRRRRRRHSGDRRARARSVFARRSRCAASDLHTRGGLHRRAPGDACRSRCTWHPVARTASLPRDRCRWRPSTSTTRGGSTGPSGCAYDGEWREAVVRSLITLKALTYAPTGGIVAAATTSLPEQLGGVRNWDYRYCWLRDATFTLYALMTGGYVDEARAWREWLLRAVAGKPSQLQIMYGVAGERRLPEWELPWLPGYEGSRAGPHRQRRARASSSSTCIGEVARRAALRAGAPGSKPTRTRWRVDGNLVEFLESAWRSPTKASGRCAGPRRHFTHSKVMAWVALDRAVKAAERFGLDGPRRALAQRPRRRFTRRCAANGFDAGRRRVRAVLRRDLLDASLLMIPLVGFLPATDPRMLGTVAAIEQAPHERRASSRGIDAAGVDGLPPGEGAFLACTFWLADNLALQGRHAEARTLFERLLDIRNDVGLLSEQYDPGARRLVGNFPQAFSHVGLVNTARNLARPGGPAAHRHES